MNEIAGAASSDGPRETAPGSDANHSLLPSIDVPHFDGPFGYLSWLAKSISG